MENKTLSREELYDLVWNEPLIKVAARFGMSDNGLRKICTRMNIPLPKAGHWQKLQFGKKIQKPLLPACPGENKIEFMFRTDQRRKEGHSSKLQNLLQKEIEATNLSWLQVPEKLSNPDKLILAARERLSSNTSYAGNGIISCFRGELNIRTTKANIPRALRFMDTFLKLMRLRGHNILIENNSTYAIVKSQKFEISLREKTKREFGISRPFSSNYLPIGILVFKVDRIFQTKEWADGKLKLEKQLSSILAKLEIAADELNSQEVIREKERQEREQQNIRKKEFEQRRENELLLVKDMLYKSERWHRAVKLRNYIDSIEQRALAFKGQSEELKKWLEWARLKANWYDPFIEAEDELLKDVDKETMIILNPKSY